MTGRIIRLRPGAVHHPPALAANSSRLEHMKAISVKVRTRKPPVFVKAFRCRLIPQFLLTWASSRQSSRPFS